MYNEGAPEFVVNQGLYYPTASNYEYLCTAFESPGDWDDRHRFFGLDGHDIQYTGLPNESIPYVYYTPSYEYAQSTYNPYNPYIPGAMMGVDGPFAGAQQYYTIPSHENPVSSPIYIPMVVQSRPDADVNGTIDPFIDYAFVNRADGPALKNNLSTKSPIFSQTQLRNASSQTNSSTGVSKGTRENTGSSKQPMTHRSVTSRRFPLSAPSQSLQVGVAQTIENVPNGKALSNHSPLKVALPPGKGLSGFRASDYCQASLDKVSPKLLYGRALDNIKVSNDLTEQKRGPRINKLKSQLVVKAYTTTAGDSDSQGNIIIYTDQYNKSDFRIDYMNAKFFVIKSYSEDDVHKSIKYNVWSSTPNGNKKLNAAYEDAQRIAAGDSRGCPIFLFFSVNASGQFCGVAEMTGPVDFHKDMDFWQQDKWSGSFPVKWRIIKDVPNPNFRHIILENNENKPVTNSRDTQEIHYNKGMEMLKIFKNYISKTSLLDDFMYYENRQKILHEEKARFLFKSYENPYLVPLINPPRRLATILDPSSEDKKVGQHDESNSSKKNESDFVKHVSSDADSLDAKPNVTDEFKITSLTIKSKDSKSECLAPASATEANDESTDVIRVGSMPIDINSSTKSSGF